MTHSHYRWVIVAAGGLLGCVAFLANDDGTFPDTTALTIDNLTARRYYRGRYLSERTVQHQLHGLIAVGVPSRVT